MRSFVAWMGALIGAGMLGWVAYNHLVEMQPAAQGRDPWPAVAFGSLLLLASLYSMTARGR